MKSQAILTASLVVILLCTSCVASECQIECSDAASCGTAAMDGSYAVASAMPEMPGMQHCSMCAPADSFSTATSSVQCSQAHCGLQPVSVREVHEPATQLVAATYVEVRALALSPHRSLTQPSPHPSSPAPLHLILRV